MSPQSERIGLALSGGSTWGIAHVGVLAAFEEAGICVDAIAGTSAGAVVAALYAFGIPVARIAEAAKKLEWKQISSFAYSRLGVSSNASIARMMTEMIGNAKIEEAKIPLAIVATNIETGGKAILREGSVAQAVQASSAIPGYFTPVEIGGALHVDGSLSENLPVSPLADLGATFTIGINLPGAAMNSRPRNVSEIIGRSFEILSHQYAALPNSLDTLIEPDLLRFDPRSFAQAQEIYDEGYRAARSAVPGIKAKLALRAIGRSNVWKRARLRIVRFFGGK